MLRRGEPLNIETQRANVDRAARAIAGLARRHDVIVAHGNGPQVGLLALQAEAYRDVPAYPLDVLGAETQVRPRARQATILAWRARTSSKLQMRLEFAGSL